MVTIKIPAECQKPDIPVHRMRDGDIGVITAWSYHHYIGIVVHRFKNNLISIRQSHGASWSDTVFNLVGEQRNQCRVRLLSPGTILVVE